MPRKLDYSKLIPKRIVNSLGHATTVWVKVDGTPKAAKRSKTLALMKAYRGIIAKVNADQKTKDWRQAAATRIMIHTGIRIGNEKSATGYVSKVSNKETQTFGLTTLKRDHVKFHNGGVTLNFIGKKGVEQTIKVKEPWVVQSIRRLYDEGHDRLLGGVSRNDVAKYIEGAIGKDYTPKDLRMMRANLEAVKYMEKVMRVRPKPKTRTQANEEVNEVLDHVSSILGNTRGVAKRSYVDEFIIDNFKTKRLKKP